MIMEKIVAQAQLMGTGNKESIAGFDISRKCPGGALFLSGECIRPRSVQPGPASPAARSAPWWKSSFDTPPSKNCLSACSHYTTNPRFVKDLTRRFCMDS